ncbi:MAG: tRNA (adenosine(37)-N6)-threonylcarbamoyltransferase complex dimerization subunit type 1 TsaB [Pseudomonadota bacterium]
MLILGINTCLAAADLALVRNGETLATRLDTAPRGHEARLPALLEDLLAEGGCKLADLDRIAVVTGPGSFTGIRIGVAFARGLALALKIDIVGVTSLEAGISPGSAGLVKTALPAQKRPPGRTWWVQTLKHGVGNSSVTEVTENELGEIIEATPIAAWAAQLAGNLIPQRHPPNPTYARMPDAKPMSPSR